MFSLDMIKETIVRLYNGNDNEIKSLAIEYGVPQSTWVVGKKKELKIVI